MDLEFPAVPTATGTDSQRLSCWALLGPENSIGAQTKWSCQGCPHCNTHVAHLGIQLRCRFWAGGLEWTWESAFPTHSPVILLLVHRQCRLVELELDWLYVCTQLEYEPVPGERAHRR